MATARAESNRRESGSDLSNHLTYKRLPFSITMQKRLELNPAAPDWSYGSVAVAFGKQHGEDDSPIRQGSPS